MIEALQLVSSPMVVSHTGLKRRLNSSRTLSDSMVRTVAAHGGVIGIGLWPKVQPDTSIDAILETVVEAVGAVSAFTRHLGAAAIAC